MNKRFLTRGPVAAMVVATILAAGLATSTARAETSAMTDAFVAATVPAYASLRRADALALLANTGGAKLRTFADHDNAAQAGAMDALVAWTGAQRRADYAASRTPSLDGLGPLFYPFDTTVIPFFAPGQNAAVPYEADLARLNQLQGSDFLAAYVERQSAILRRLIAVYTDYIENGDDPALRLLSVQNLPKAKRLLAELARV